MIYDIFLSIRNQKSQPEADQPMTEKIKNYLKS